MKRVLVLGIVASSLGGCVGNAPSRRSGGEGGSAAISFAERVIPSGASQAHDHPRWGDRDGDGVLDVATMAGDGTNLFGFRGTGAGQFEGGTVVISNLDTTLEHDFSIGHLDTDNHADFLVAHAVVSGVGDPVGVRGTMTGLTDWSTAGSLVFLESAGTDTVAGTVCSVQLHDVDGDALDDAVLAGSDGASCQSGSGFVSVYPRTAPSTFADTPRPVASGYLPAFVEVVDAQLSGTRQDLLVGDQSAGRVITYFGPAFDASREVKTANAPVAAAMGDLDGVGLLEIVAVGTGGAVEVFVDDGNGSYVRGSNLPAPGDAVDVAIFDLDGDGDNDVLLGLTGEIRYALNEGDGAIQAFADVLFAGEITGRMAVADTDGDGRVDTIVSPNALGGLLVLYRE